MIALDEEFLASVGLGDLPPEDQRSLLAAIHQQLALTVGLRLGQRISVDDAQEFETLLEAGDEDRARAWLEAHVPDYPEVVREALDEQMDELRSRREEILDAVGVEVTE